MTDADKATVSAKYKKKDFWEFTDKGAAIASPSKGAFTSRAYDKVFKCTGSKPLAKAAYAAALVAYRLYNE